MKSFEKLTVSNVVKILTAGVYNPSQFAKARSAVVSVEDAALRFTVDGAPPTTTVGHLVGSGDTIELSSANEIKYFQAIRTTGTDSVINVTYDFGE